MYFEIRDLSLQNVLDYDSTRLLDTLCSKILSFSNDLANETLGFVIDKCMQPSS